MSKLNLQPHEERVLDEYEELSERKHKLSSFLESDKAHDINKDDLKLLVKQELAMEVYLQVLEDRIMKFEGVFDWMDSIPFEDPLIIPEVKTPQKQKDE